MEVIISEFLSLLLRDLSVLEKVLILFNIVQFSLLVKFIMLYRIDLKKTREMNKIVLAKISRMNSLINYVISNKFEKHTIISLPPEEGVSSDD